MRGVQTSMHVRTSINDIRGPISFILKILVPLCLCDEGFFGRWIMYFFYFKFNDRKTPQHTEAQEFSIQRILSHDILAYELIWYIGILTLPLACDRTHRRWRWDYQLQLKDISLSWQTWLVEGW